jgi:hypothetical protein
VGNNNSEKTRDHDVINEVIKSGKKLSKELKIIVSENWNDENFYLLFYNERIILSAIPIVHFGKKIQNL